MPQNLILVVPLLPLIGLGLFFQGRATRWPMSLLLWAITFGHSEARLKALESQFPFIWWWEPWWVSSCRWSLSD
jgi:phosphatidylglycerophosphatase C